MPEFISRPNFGAASELWSKAIQMAAQRSNPMAQGISEGLDTLGKGIEMWGQQQGATKANERSVQAQTVEHDRMADAATLANERAAQTLYRGHVADLALRGQLGGQLEGMGTQGQPAVAPPVPSNPYLMNQQGVPISGQGTSPLMQAQPTQPAQRQLMTSDLAGMLGAKLEGENWSINAPRGNDKYADWVRKFEYKINRTGIGRNTDPMMREAINATRLYMLENPSLIDSVDDNQFMGLVQEFYSRMGQMRSGKYPPSSPKKKEPAKPQQPGWGERVWNYVTSSGKSTALAPPAKATGENTAKLTRIFQ